MSWLGAWRDGRALRRTAAHLQAADRQLHGLFALFGRLHDGEPLPWRERRLRRRLGREGRRAVVACAGAAVAVALLSLWASSGGAARAGPVRGEAVTAARYGALPGSRDPVHLSCLVPARQPAPDGAG